MNVELSTEASNDLEVIKYYLKSRSKSGLEHVLLDIYKSCSALATAPYIGRRTSQKQIYLRFSIKYRYKIFYKVHQNHVEILRILHPRQLKP